MKGGSLLFCSDKVHFQKIKSSRRVPAVFKVYRVTCVRMGGLLVVGGLVLFCFSPFFFFRRCFFQPYWARCWWCCGDVAGVVITPDK